jgi:hypothetical protein
MAKVTKLDDGPPPWVKGPTPCTQKTNSHIEHTKHGAVKVETKTKR